MKVKLTNTILVCAGLLFGILALEISLRIYLKDDYGVPTHRNWQFRKIWDDKFENLNSLGHRDHEFTAKKPQGTFRILAIGDSLTYGQGIKDVGQIFTEILEKKLNTVGRNLQYEVLNVSKKGWNVRDYLSALRSPGLSYEPDLVLIAFYLNDIEANQRKRPRMGPITRSVHLAIGRLSYVYWYSYNAISKLSNTNSRWLDYYLSYTSPDSDDWKQFVHYWRELLTTCNRNNIRALVVILPHTNWPTDSHPFVAVYRNVEKLSRDNGALVLNLFPFIKGYNPRELHVGITDGHPSELAHRIYADKIFEFIRHEKLVPTFE